ncbi:MAG TPA: metalloregulator ArsR/SmtB family transcription factor [Bacteroidota bacterium]|nr:metalloregulator ArsR/SmtB family transcription factor [Bacteroidota bacterium]
MAINKKYKFNRQQNALADFANAISHPARVAILKEVAKRNTCICGEIVEILPLAQSTVSRHLKDLLKTGLLKGRIDGVKSCYCINWDTFEKFSESFHSFFVQTKASARSHRPKCS